jgi:hypothetical protein
VGEGANVIRLQWDLTMLDDIRISEEIFALEAKQNPSAVVQDLPS